MFLAKRKKRLTHATHYTAHKLYFTYFFVYFSLKTNLDWHSQANLLPIKQEATGYWVFFQI